jgi:hypothetical protein
MKVVALVVGVLFITFLGTREVTGELLIGTGLSDNQTHLLAEGAMGVLVALLAFGLLRPRPGRDDI